MQFKITVMVDSDAGKMEVRSDPGNLDPAAAALLLNQATTSLLVKANRENALLIDPNRLGGGLNATRKTS